MVKRLKEWLLPADGGLPGEGDHFMGHTLRHNLVRQALQVGLISGQIAGQTLHKNVDSVTLYSQGTAPMLRLMGKTSQDKSLD